MVLSDTQKALLENIQRKLVKGDIKSIAEKVKKTDNYVSMVLNPDSEYFNMDIVETAAKIISTREENTKKLLEKITSAA